MKTCKIIFSNIIELWPCLCACYDQYFNMKLSLSLSWTKFIIKGVTKTNKVDIILNKGMMRMTSQVRLIKEQQNISHVKTKNDRKSKMIS